MLPMLLQSLLGLAFVLGLFALLVWAMRRVQSHLGKHSTNFRVMQKIHIDNRNSIVEINHQGKQYLLALSPGGIIQLRSDHAQSSTIEQKELTPAISHE
ncbi:MAG: flagellar biosynthetic protein FliO [Mariprofundus sp.]|nr:flagellar biosynthetic protein FliO [Mariprofundus sp.]